MIVLRRSVEITAISGHWLTVNATSKPPHLGASRAYLKHVTVAEICEEGGHEKRRVLEIRDLIAQRLKSGLFK